MGKEDPKAKQKLSGPERRDASRKSVKQAAGQHKTVQAKGTLKGTTSQVPGEKPRKKGQNPPKPRHRH